MGRHGIPRNLETSLPNMIYHFSEFSKTLVNNNIGPEKEKVREHFVLSETIVCDRSSPLVGWRGDEDLHSPHIAARDPSTLARLPSKKHKIGRPHHLNAAWQNAP
jgi:hypothetical protein